MIGSAGAALKILLNGDSSGAIRSMDAVERRAVQMSANLKRQGAAMMGFGAAIITSLGVASVKLGAYAQDILKSATKTGTGAEEFQRLKYAVEQNEGSVESLTRSMVFLRNSAAAAIRTAGAQRAGFEALDVSFQNADGTIRNTTAILLDLSHALVTAKDPGMAAANVLALIGKRGGAELLPLLMQGRAGILLFMAAAEGIISKETLETFKTWQDHIGRVKVQLLALLMEGIKPMLPYFHKTIDFIERMVKGLQALSPETKKSIGQFVLFGAAALIAFGGLIFLIGSVKGLMFLGAPLAVKILLVVVALDAFYRAGGAVSAMIGDFVASLGYLIRLIPGLEQFINIYSRLWGGKGGFSATGMEEFGQRMSARGQTQFETGLVGEAKALIGGIEGKLFGGTAAAGAAPSGPTPLAMVPSRVGGAPVFALPSLRTVSQMGQNRTVYFQGNFDTTADGVQAMNNVVNDNF